MVWCLQHHEPSGFQAQVTCHNLPGQFTYLAIVLAWPVYKEPKHRSILNARCADSQSPEFHAPPKRMPDRMPERIPDRPRRSRRRTATLPADAPEVASPCISICEIDQQTGLCGGCYRTLEEIATWSRIPNQRRWEIVQSLRDRRAECKRTNDD